MGLDRTQIGTALEAVGIISLVIGAALLSIPAAFIVAGIMLVLAGAANS